MFRLAVFLELLLLCPLAATSQEKTSENKPVCGYEQGFFCRTRLAGIRIENSTRGLFENRGRLRLSRYRLNFDGYLFKPELTFRFSAELASGRQIRDAYLNWEFFSSPTTSLNLQAGKFKVPFGRQGLAGTNSLLLIHRSSVSQDLSLNRQTGAKIGVKYNKFLAVDAGLFRRGTYSGRIIFSPTGEFGLEESDWKNGNEPEFAVGLNYARDEVEKRNLIGYEFLFKFRGLSMQGEKIRELGSRRGGFYLQRGFYLQSGYFLLPRRLELGGRYGRLAANKKTQEVSLGANYYIWQRHLLLRTNIGKEFSENRNRATAKIVLDFIF